MYIGNRGISDVLENRNVVEELEEGVMVAFTDKINGALQLARVVSIPPNPTIDSMVKIVLFKQERAANKSKWNRYFFESEATDELKILDIVLYDFKLTQMGALKKRTKEYFIDNNYFL